jgi:hypothetical protein
MFRRRETMIALRARRQALDIASEVAHPRVKQPMPVLAVDAPPDEPPGRIPPDDVEAIKKLISACAIIAVSVSAFALIFYRVYWPH